METALFDKEKMLSNGATLDYIENVYHDTVEKIIDCFDGYKIVTKEYFLKDSKATEYYSIKNVIDNFLSFFKEITYIDIDDKYITIGDIIYINEYNGVNPIDVWQSYINGGVSC